MVRLKALEESMEGGCDPCFNSSMVRLKAFNVSYLRTRRSLFQFLNGAIKSVRL